MSDHDAFSRRHRSRILLIVEGKTEKETLFRQLLYCFPEISVREEDILVYHTNIYSLYEQIHNEYDDDWEAVDLPFLLSRSSGQDRLWARDFTDIYLIFDYERQDPCFSEEKIQKLQSHFLDSTGNGKLYINYPMVESYLDLNDCLLDRSYRDRSVFASMQRGGTYKRQFDKRARQWGLTFASDLDKGLAGRYGVTNDALRKACCTEILHWPQGPAEGLNDILSSCIPDEVLKKQAVCQIYAAIKKFCRTGESYRSFLRRRFQSIIYNNLCKANQIQNGLYTAYCLQCDKECVNAYASMDFRAILDRQNESSRDCGTGLIWVLNTCVFFVTDYNRKLLFVPYETT